ncbi:MAG: DUF4956 domain-containing protein [Verrucomicrobia bacterium]|nr:DUF4956 domain-containing protein [Verrucomicrobiota bacterium]
MLESFLHGDYASAPTSFPTLALALLLAFLMGQLIAWVYMLTHDGLSYSRAFVVSLVILPVTVALVMMVLANSLVTAFGLMAVFAVVRFRNILRDTLDTAHVLAAIVIGMACGTQKFTTAILGGGVLAAVMLYAWLTKFGRRHHYDFILNLHWARPVAELPALSRLLERHSRKARVAQQRVAPDRGAADLSYHLLLRDPDRAEELLSELNALPGATDVNGVRADSESEV